jgi:hypothetical protein
VLAPAPPVASTAAVVAAARRHPPEPTADLRPVTVRIGRVELVVTAPPAVVAPTPVTPPPVSPPQHPDLLAARRGYGRGAAG